jgi:hypothetical protein
MDDQTLAGTVRQASAPRTHRFAGYLWAVVTVLFPPILLMIAMCCSRLNLGGMDA